MNKSPTIVQVEYDPFYQINVDLILAGVNLSLAAKAGNKHELERLYQLIAQKKLTPDIVIIGEDQLASSAASESIAKRFRQLLPEVKLIDYTVARGEESPWADGYAVKSGLDQSNTIIKALSKILGFEVANVNEDVDAY